MTVTIGNICSICGPKRKNIHLYICDYCGAGAMCWDCWCQHKDQCRSYGMLW
jgi:hypothetical protein